MSKNAATPIGHVHIELPSQLLQVIAKAMTAREQASLRAVFEASARAIAALGDMDLARYEADDEGEEAYQVWEELAPVVGDTMTVIHALLETIAREIPEPPATPQSQMERAVAIIRPNLDKLRHEIQGFRDGMRRPENMADRWNVLAYLAAFRGRIRAEIGEMVHAASLCFENVDKADVVPQYRRDMEEALGLRRALAGLAREVAVIDSQMELATAEPEVLENAVLLLGRIQTFTKSSHYRQLRVIDRRLFARVLAILGAQGSAVEIMAVTSELFTFLKEISINRREMLVRHDRDALASALNKLEQAKAALDAGLRNAREALAGAVSVIVRLEGRGPVVDEVIDRYRGADFRASGLDELGEQIVEIEGLLQRLRQ